jgi:hypothetical protein
MSDALAFVGGIGSAMNLFREKKKTVERFDDGGDAAIMVFLILYIVFAFLIWGVAFYLASFCADPAINYILAFLFPIIYIIVRLIAPCKR